MLLAAPEHPGWWSLAVCRGAGADTWTPGQGDAVTAKALRAACAGCPVAGDCLREAMTLPLMLRHQGPMRCGVTGTGWKRVDRAVRDLAPTTDADWDVLAAMLLDGDL